MIPTFACQCGEEYRHRGEGRHRVFWPADATVSDPVMSDACPKRDTPLAEQVAAV